MRVGRRSYYRSVTLDGNLTVNVGDHVIINGDTATDSRLQLHVGVIAKIYDETGGGGGQAHVQWFGRRSDTVLGGTGDPTELFRLRVCEDVPLLSIWRKCTVTCVTQQNQDTWRLAGGTVPEDAMKDDGVSFWYRFEYIPVWARFQYPVPWPECPEDRVPDCNFCGVCSSEQVEGNRYQPRICEKLADDVQSVTWDRAPLKIGDCIYLAPGSVKMAIKKKKVKTFTKPMKEVDEEIYPEFYRKKGDNHKRATPDPFHIVIIKKIFEDCGELKLEVRILYRPEDTHEGASAAESALANELFWTEETASVGFDRVEGRAYVKFFNISISDEHICCWTEAGPHRWFFRSSYDPSMRQFEIVDTGYRPKDFLFPTYPQGVRKLRCLNIFSGCGGLSHGLYAGKNS